jgi:hypothetical protein
VRVFLQAAYAGKIAGLLRFSERFRESGDGWQTRVDAALREWLKKHSPA